MQCYREKGGSLEGFEFKGFDPFNPPTNIKCEPLMYWSKGFDKHQMNWHISCKELYALILACEKWRLWLVPDTFVAFNDHANLVESDSILQASRRTTLSSDRAREVSFLASARELRKPS